MSGAGDHELHRVRGDSSPDGRGDQEALSPSLSVSAPSAEVVPLPRRRTYIDAAREQGVHQEREELLAEKARLTADVDRHNASLGKPVTHNADVVDIAESGGISRAAFDAALAQQRAEIEGRVAGICAAIEAWPHCGPWFPLFAHLLKTSTMQPDDIAPLLAAASSQGQHEGEGAHR